MIRQIARNAGGGYLFLAVTEEEEHTTSYVYRSSDDGLTWTVFEALEDGQDPGNIVADLIPNPTRSNRLFITTYAGALLVSEDAGESWRSVAQPASATAEGVTPPQLAFRPDAPDAVLLVRGQNNLGAGLMQISRSTDGGLTWHDVGASGLPARGAPRALAALPGGVFLLNTSTGTFRSADGGFTWQPLEGALSSGGVAEFLPLDQTSGSLSPGAATSDAVVLAATGHGLYISLDSGAIWAPLGAGMPFNSKIAGLLTHPGSPGQVFAVSDNMSSWGAVQPPMILRSLDGGQRWSAAAAGLPDAPATAWALDPNDPNTLFVASWEQVFRSSDAGLSWQSARLETGAHNAIAVAASDGNVIYLGGRPAMRSSDRGLTWTPMPVILPGEVAQTHDLSGLIVDPEDAAHLWAALDGGGVFESRDAGRSWNAVGLTDRPVRWLAAGAPGQADGAGGSVLYAGVAEDGIYRGDADGWTAASEGLPPRSTILAFVTDPRTTGLLWAARDGGGVYRSTDGGQTWGNVGLGVGDNLAQTLAVDYSLPDGVLMGTATTGVWSLRPDIQPASFSRQRNQAHDHPNDA
jgi:photosystem II stability/assembly factor-like uncharacterized protein